MARAQIYANVKQVMDDINLPGDEPGLLERIREASAQVCALMGDWVPVTESRTFDADENGKTAVDPLIAIVTIVDGDGVTIASTDYELLPHNKLWANGPYRYVDGPGGGEMVIAGRWGLWELWENLVITGTLAAADTASLAVTNGALLWPGMVIKIEDEQMLVTAGNGGENSPAATAAVSLLNGTITESVDVIVVDNGTEFNAGEVLQIGVEDMLIKRKGGNSLVVARGWNNTTRDDHLNDAAIGVYRTFTIERGVNGTTAAAHAAKAIYKYRLPEDINYLTRQMAALMRMKAQTGFSGRAGNTDAGESFFVNEFPHRVIEAVRWNYKF